VLRIYLIIYSKCTLVPGELWTGSEIGGMRAWPWEVAEKALFTDLRNNFSNVYLMEGSCIDLRSRVATTGASILNTDIRFLVSDHSRGRVWSGGSYSLAVWYISVFYKILGACISISAK